jgi:hypothetical protein
MPDCRLIRRGFGGQLTHCQMGYMHARVCDTLPSALHDSQRIGLALTRCPAVGATPALMIVRLRVMHGIYLASIFHFTMAASDAVKGQLDLESFDNG